MKRVGIFAASVPIIHNAWASYVSNDFTTFDDVIELCMWVCSARIDITTAPRGCAKKLLRKHPKALRKGFDRNAHISGIYSK
jgi:hypothetical protein